MAPDARFFSDAYAAARTRFLAAAEARGAALSAWPIDERGPAGEELAVDVAYLGPEAPQALLVLSSGIHGVEGFAGSALQLQLLTAQWPGLALPPDAGLLLVHALNPWGFAWRRRVNERNVDVNRNFVAHPEGHVENAPYEALRDAINPARLDAESDRESRAALTAFAREHGLQRLQQALTAGQYRYPQGVQYGGGAPEASNRHLRAIAAGETRGARRVLWIDFHTGLGPSGALELIVELAPEAPGYRRARAWFGAAVTSTLAGDSSSVALPGVIEWGLEASLPAGTELTALAAEFGTHPSDRVFWAMRADNWLRHHGDRESEQGQRIVAELMEAFRPADPTWERTVLAAGGRLLGRAASALAGADAISPERAFPEPYR